MNNSGSIKKMVEQLYTDRDQTGDAIFFVGSERIRAHRNVLAALSPKYKAQFYGPNPDQGEIRILNVSAVAFREFLQFFYKETVELSMNNIESVLDLAKQSLNDEFMETCVNFLKKSIQTSNVCFVYRLAILYDIESLCGVCERQISFKTMDVFGSDDFLQCDHDVLMHILKLDTLKCTEMNTFNACIAWARADCSQKGLDETKPENLRAALDDATHLIRFSSINTQELATALFGSLNGLFSVDELDELFIITSKVEGFTSQKFNQTPRTQPRDNLKAIVGSHAWTLECDRFVERTIRAGPDTNTRLESVIHCDNPIRLFGLVFAFNLTEDALKHCEHWKSVSIYVTRDNQPFVKIVKRCKFYQVKDETIILFDSPVENLEAFKIYLGLHRLQANSKVVLKDHVVVDNNKFTCSGELVTRFFFDNI